MKQDKRRQIKTKILHDSTTSLLNEPFNANIIFQTGVDTLYLQDTLFLLTTTLKINFKIFIEKRTFLGK